MNARARSTGSPAAQDEHAAKKAPIGDLTPEEVCAINAVFGKEAKTWRDSLTPGLNQPVDVLLRIVGQLDVGDDQPRTETSKPQLLPVLAVVFDELGPKSRVKVREALVRRLGSQNAGRDAREPDAEASGFANATIELLTIREPKTVRGNVVAKLEVQVMPRKAA